jgi:HTH-type transcriptional regulator/antitoxin HigA
MMFYPAETLVAPLQQPSLSELISHLINSWSPLSKVLRVPHSNTEYQRLLALFNHLLEEVPDDETHPWIGLLETLRVLIEQYETEHYPVPEVTGEEVLQFLMEQNELTPHDLPELGDHFVVEEILNGKRLLNSRQIRVLGERFGVSPAVFL